jgi:hypothetical protein
MRLLKKGLIALLIVLVAIQFIQPARNANQQEISSDIAKQYNVPLKVQGLLRTACYDCHSNNTRYPWYANIQPMGWLLADHIKDGKAELNFDEFGSYPKRRQLSKLKSIAGSVKDGSMPIASYTWMHRNAKLLAEKRALIIDWAIRTRDSLEVKN